MRYKESVIFRKRWYRESFALY